jgi:hypothetical protein
VVSHRGTRRALLQNVLTGDLMRMVGILVRDRVAQVLDNRQTGSHTEFDRKKFVKSARLLDEVPAEQRRRVLNLAHGDGRGSCWIGRFGPSNLGSRNLDRDRHPADDDGCASDAGGLTCRTPYGSLAGVSAPFRLACPIRESGVFWPD